MTDVDWMEVVPDPCPRDYRKRRTLRPLWHPPFSVARHRTNKRGRGIVGRLFGGKRR